MAQKKFKQNFAADFGGIDGLSSAIEDDEGKVNLATNFEYAASNSLRGITGFQRAANSSRMFGIFPYVYSRTQDQYVPRYQVASGVYPNQTGDTSSTKTTADGATIQKLIGINDQIWSLENLTIPVAVDLANYPFTWYNAPDGDPVSPTYKFNIFNTIATVATSLASINVQAITIYSLLNQLNALADFTINPFNRSRCPPCAIVRTSATLAPVGTTTYGTTYTVDVDNSPHTFRVGDIITFSREAFPIGGPTGTLIAGVVTGVTLNTITYCGPPATVLVGDVLGYMGQAAATFPVADTSIASSGDVNLVFPYWKFLPEGDRSDLPNTTIAYEGAFKSAKTLFNSRFQDSFYAPPNAVNNSGNLYIASSSTESSSNSILSSYAGNLIRVDGQQPLRAGLPTPTISIGASGGALTGVYKYKVFYRFVDAQGNIIDGPVFSVATQTFAANSLGILVNPPGAFARTYGFQARNCLKNTTETFASGAFFYVDDGTAGAPPFRAPFLQVGDPIALIDSTLPLAGLGPGGSLVNPGTLVRSVITDICSEAATISPTSFSIKIAKTTSTTVNDNAPMSAGLTAVVLRTAAGGNQFYKLYETPIATSAIDFNDNVTDANLITQEQYVEIPLGKEHDTPPRCSIVCQHQGGLVVARGFNAPNTVSFSSVDGPEYFPLASNSIDVPSTQSGPVSAIASDTNDRLAVFKRRGYYDIVGDLDGGNFSVNVKNEGDYGITSHASIARVRDSLIGLSDNGFVVIKDGELFGNVFNDINASLVNRPTAAFEWAVATNDAYGRNYACSLPAVATLSGTRATIDYALDYSRGPWVAFGRKYLDGGAAGGLVSLGSDLYFLNYSNNTVYRRHKRFTPTTTLSYPPRTEGDYYFQDVFNGVFILESNVINLGEPDVLNTPIRVRIWSIPNEYGTDGWLPFTLKVLGKAGTAGFGTGLNFQGDTNAVISFTSNGPGFIDVKLKQDKKTHFYILRLQTSGLPKQAPFITGYEILYSENYKAEDLVK
jgi:hypothetical protein